jgi:hypothetical protein
MDASGSMSFFSFILRARCRGKRMVSAIGEAVWLAFQPLEASSRMGPRSYDRARSAAFSMFGAPVGVRAQPNPSTYLGGPCYGPSRWPQGPSSAKPHRRQHRGSQGDAGQFRHRGKSNRDHSVFLRSIGTSPLREPRIPVEFQTTLCHHIDQSAPPRFQCWLQIRLIETGHLFTTVDAASRARFQDALPGCSEFPKAKRKKKIRYDTLASCSRLLRRYNEQEVNGNDRLRSGRANVAAAPSNFSRGGALR